MRAVNLVSYIGLHPPFSERTGGVLRACLFVKSVLELTYFCRTDPYNTASGVRV